MQDRNPKAANLPNALYTVTGFASTVACGSSIVLWKITEFAGVKSTDFRSAAEGTDTENNSISFNGAPSGGMAGFARFKPEFYFGFNGDFVCKQSEIDKSFSALIPFMTAERNRGNIMLFSGIRMACFSFALISMPVLSQEMSSMDLNKFVKVVRAAGEVSADFSACDMSTAFRA